MVPTNMRTIRYTDSQAGEAGQRIEEAFGSAAVVSRARTMARTLNVQSRREHTWTAARDCAV